MADEIDVDKLGATLGDRILAGLRGRSAAGDDDEDYGRRPRTVPFDRLQREIDKRKAAEAALEEVQAKLPELEQGYKAKIQALQEETAQQLKGIGQRHQEDIALIDAGLTDAMGRQVVRQAWESAPKDARGKSPSEWWAQTLEAHQAHLADPEAAAAPTVPRPLTPYLPQPDADGGKGKPAPSGRPAPRVPSTGRPPQAPSLDALPDDDMGSFLEGLRKLG